MLNKNIIKVLQSINGISNSVILRYPTTILNSAAGDVVVRIGMAQLDTESFDDIGIFNLSEFISTFNLFDEYEASVSDNIISIKSGNNSVQYLTTNINVLENFNKNEKVFTSTEAVPSVCSVSLTEDDIKTIKSAASVFKDLSDIIFVSKDGDLEVKLGNTNNFNAKSNSFSIKKPGSNCTKEFTIKVPTENFNAIPLSEYNFEVKYNSERDAYRVMLKSTEADISILLAVKK